MNNAELIVAILRKAGDRARLRHPVGQRAAADGGDAHRRRRFRAHLARGLGRLRRRGDGPPDRPARPRHRDAGAGRDQPRDGRRRGVPRPLADDRDDLQPAGRAARAAHPDGHRPSRAVRADREGDARAARGQRGGDICRGDRASRCPSRRARCISTCPRTWRPRRPARRCPTSPWARALPPPACGADLAAVAAGHRRGEAAGGRDRRRRATAARRGRAAPPGRAPRPALRPYHHGQGADRRRPSARGRLHRARLPPAPARIPARRRSDRRARLRHRSRSSTRRGSATSRSLHVGIAAPDTDGSVDGPRSGGRAISTRRIAALADAPPARNGWTAGELAAHRARFEAALRPASEGFAPHQAIDAVRRVLPADGVLAFDVGAHTHQIASQWAAPAPGRFLITNGWSSMGFGLPAAIAAKLAAPGPAGRVR